MSYQVKKDDNGKVFIFEKQSGVEIKIANDENCARKVCRKLNLGSGFNGWTPNFFASTVGRKTW